MNRILLYSSGIIAEKKPTGGELRFLELARYLAGKETEEGKSLRHLEEYDHTDPVYEVDVDLPGFKKEEIHLELENGYLTISTEKSLENKEEKQGRVLRQERYSGTMSRSFYVGENVTEEEIKARYENGVLSLTVPKKDAQKVPEKKTICIEG